MFKGESVHGIATGLVLSFIYITTFIYCFTEWTLVNPFAFVSEIPTMTKDDRFGYLAGFCGCYFAAYWAAYTIVLMRSDKKKVDDDVLIESYRESYSLSEPVAIRSGPDAVDIAVGVGLGIVGGGIVSDIFGIDD